MSFNARNRYDPSRRRRRRNIHNHSSSSHSHITRLATTAALAYGAYRLGSWAWDSYFGNDNYNDEENYVFGEGSGYDSESESESDDYDDACAQSSRPNGNDEDDEPSRKDLRSRRSRGDWSKYNHRHRSHPHSPHHHHHHDNATAKKTGSKSNNNNSVGSSVGEKIMTSTTAAIGAAVSAGISAGINAYNTNNNNVASAQFIRSSRMERCRLEASRAMMDFLPTLKKAIVKETDITSEMEELKSIRTQKKRDLQSKNGDDAPHTHQLRSGDNDVRERERELWNNIKNKSITRLVTTIYAHTIVFLVLTVQVNLLGGRLLREEQEKNHHQQQGEDDKDESLDEQSSDDESDRYRSSHKTVLAKTYHHVFAKGIPSLAAAVAKAVDDALQNWDVLGGDDASLDDVSSWLETVRDVIEKRQEKGGNNSSSSTTGALVQFVIPDEMGQSNDEPMMDDLARYILDETYDLLESPTYAHAERLCLDITFTNLREEGYANLFPSPTRRRNNKHMNEVGDGAVDERRKPLAKVITHLSKPTVATFYETPSHKAEMDDWEGVFKMMEEPLPSSPNVYIPNLSHAVTELSDICFN